MTAKSVFWLPIVILLTFSPAANGQQRSKLPRIGWLSAGASSTEFPEKQALDGLRELGWIDGKTATIDFRYAAGNSERLAQMATELVDLNVDVIVTFSAGVAVAKRATATIPIVFGTSQDPVRAGFVASLARPGSNLTGASFLTDELSGKRLELLKETIPSLTRAAVVWEPAHVDNEFKGMQLAAPELKLKLRSIEIPRPTGPDEVARAIKAALDGSAKAIVLAPSGFTILHRKQIIELAARNRLPVISAWRIFADDGAIFTYGPNLSELSERIAVFVDKILKGAKPTDLPVEQPKKFEFIVNLKAAKKIGLTIPPNLLVRADKVIR
jgi:putative ABC transport system substrate-binding protein